jgi:hypothetical protein
MLMFFMSVGTSLRSCVPWDRNRKSQHGIGMATSLYALC